MDLLVIRMVALYIFRNFMHGKTQVRQGTMSGWATSLTHRYLHLDFSVSIRETPGDCAQPVQGHNRSVNWT